jgi:fructose-bisphosphate aldolase class 1
MRDERDAAERKVLAEKEKGIEMKDTLLKQQTVTANMGALFDKMRTLIGQSDDKKLKEDLERFLEAYE